MIIKTSDLPVLTGRETSLPDVCIHPEHGVCVARRSPHVQEPSSWKDVAWRAPPLPEDGGRRVNTMTDRQMARLGGLIDHVTIHIGALCKADAMGPKRLGSFSAKYRAHHYVQMLLGQWRGVIPTPPYLVAEYGPMCRFRLHDRMGRWALYLDAMTGRRVIAQIDMMPVRKLMRVDDPMIIIRHALKLFGQSMTAERRPVRGWRDDDAIAHRIMCSALSRIDMPRESCLMGSLVNPGQGISSTHDVMLSWGERRGDRRFLSLSPGLQSELRGMVHADSEFRAMEIGEILTASLGLSALFTIGRVGQLPTAMEILRHSVHEDGSPQVLTGPDGTDPGHPRTEWLVPIHEARMIGLPRLPEIEDLQVPI